MLVCGTFNTVRGQVCGELFPRLMMAHRFVTKETERFMVEHWPGHIGSRACSKQAQQDALQRAATTAIEVEKYRQDYHVERMTKILDDVSCLLDDYDYMYDHP